MKKAYFEEAKNKSKIAMRISELEVKEMTYLEELEE